MTVADRYRAECYLIGTGEKIYTDDAHNIMCRWALDRCNLAERPTAWRIYEDVAVFANGLRLRWRSVDVPPDTISVTDLIIGFTGVTPPRD